MDEAPATEPQHIYLFYGDDALGISERVQELCTEYGDLLNIARLDGKQCSLDQLHTEAYVLPFFTERRLVIVHNPFDLTKSQTARERFINILTGLPETTTVALVVPDQYIPSGNKRGWVIMDDAKKGGKFFLAWSKKTDKRVGVDVYRPPSAYEMPKWIISCAIKEGGDFTPAAAAALAQLTGSDKGLARQEILKLIAYVNYSRAVDLDDVQEAAASGGVSDIFGMVDALAVGDNAKALRLLQQLLEEQDANSLFGMVVRQYRLLLMTKEALADGPLSDEKLGKRINAHPFVAGKMKGQARHYNLTDLEAIYHRLAELDMIMKTGGADPQTALQSFVAAPTAAHL
jgi:DNA polymerase III subunit delta